MSVEMSGLKRNQLTMTNTTATPGFTGWHRPDRRFTWRAVVSAPTEAEAWARLLDYAAGDKCGLPVGQDPNQAGGKRTA